jgi:hypothetical protein
MKKILLSFICFAVVVALILIARLSGGFFSGRPLFPDYRREKVISFSSSELGWIIEKEQGVWILRQEKNIFPVDEKIVDEILRIPGEVDRHLAGTVSADSSWLPDNRMSLTFREEEGNETVLYVYFDNSVEGLLIGKEPEGGKIYFSHTTRADSLFIENLVNYELFPSSLSANDIIYYRIYTPLEGGEAILYRYELVYENNLWSCLSELDDSPVIEESVHLLLLRLAGLKGDLLLSTEDFHEEGLRFRVEIRDNRGNRYVLDVGESLERNGTTYYLTRLEGRDELYGLTREKLSGIAPALNTLLEF